MGHELVAPKTQRSPSSDDGGLLGLASRSRVSHTLERRSSQGIDRVGKVGQLTWVRFPSPAPPGFKDLEGPLGALRRFRPGIARSRLVRSGWRWLGWFDV